MAIGNAKILAVLREKLATLSLERKAGDDAEPGERQIAEEIFKAAQGSEFEDSKELHDPPCDENEVYEEFREEFDNIDFQTTSSIGKLLEKVGNLRTRILTASVERMQRRLERLKEEEEELREHLKDAREDLEMTATELEVHKLKEKNAAENLKRGTKQVKATEAKLELLRKSLRSEEQCQQSESPEQCAQKKFPKRKAQPAAAQDASRLPGSGTGYSISPQPYLSPSFSSQPNPAIGQSSYRGIGAYTATISTPFQQSPPSLMTSYGASYGSSPTAPSLLPTRITTPQPAPTPLAAVSTSFESQTRQKHAQQADGRKDSQKSSKGQTKNHRSKKAFPKSDGSTPRSSAATTLPMAHPTQAGSRSLGATDGYGAPTGDYYPTASYPQS